MNKSILRPALALFLFTVVSAVIVGVGYAVTVEPIAAQRARIEAEAITALIPESYRTEPHPINLPDSTLTRHTLSFDQDGNFLGHVFSASSPGYSGAINMMVALDDEGTILGVRVISHTETPGLGSNIAQAWFKDQFVGLTGPVVSVRSPSGPNEIDVITGSTISVNAVLRGVNDAVEYFGNLP